MNSQITTYQLPSNPNIVSGHIYTFYINNNTNLDLSSIITAKSIRVKNLGSSETTVSSPTDFITMSQEDYTRLLELNNLAYQLTTKRTMDIQNFINEETKTTAELTNINTERQELIRKLTKGSEKNHERTP